MCITIAQLHDSYNSYKLITYPSFSWYTQNHNGIVASALLAGALASTVLDKSRKGRRKNMNPSQNITEHLNSSWQLTSLFSIFSSILHEATKPQYPCKPPLRSRLSPLPPARSPDIRHFDLCWPFTLQVLSLSENPALSSTYRSILWFEMIWDGLCSSRDSGPQQAAGAVQMSRLKGCAIMADHTPAGCLMMKMMIDIDKHW